MKKSVNNFCWVLVALLCAGVVVTSCEGFDPLGGENTDMSLVAPTLDAASEVNYFDAVISCKVTLPSEISDGLEYGVQYCTSQDFTSNVVTKKAGYLDSENKFSMEITSLTDNTTYYYRSYIELNGVSAYSEPKSFKTHQYPYNIQKEFDISSATDLSSSGSANCYVVSNTGTYKFKPVKGNSTTPVGSVASAAILWETFGTSTVPEMFDLIKAFCYRDGYIAFQTADTFKEGNAVIAAKDASGTILWSWHIWLTDQPEEQVYNRGGGTMMDRNLGATSATPGDVGALGLLYQWGRKDPFLGSSSIHHDDMELAKSTITWPLVVSSDSNNGTIAYATAHPTTFIDSTIAGDWYYTGSSSIDDIRWTTSDKKKSIYDPCPDGWRVPDGGEKGVWPIALDIYTEFTDKSLYNSTNEGANFFGMLGPARVIWYPASGFLNYSYGSLRNVGYCGIYWSASPYSHHRAMNSFALEYYGHCLPFASTPPVYGCSVRCYKEDSARPEPEPTYQDIATSGTANSYIISKSGAYYFPIVKGNSLESVGSVASAEVLWESFGTDVEPSGVDLVKNVKFSDGKIKFKTADTFKEGNAVIAAKDASGTILWSWHIWFTDEPQGQVYYNNAGTMMDRNLGATSATPGDVGALGLLYQWGRKDPFLGAIVRDGAIKAASCTIRWPSAVSADSSRGTVSYVTANPTTYVKGVSSSDDDWHYSSRENTLWTTSDKPKSIYDPCPAGWRVPDGGETGVWAVALGPLSDFEDESLFDGTNVGMNFAGGFGSSSTIWYPASGCRYSFSGLYYLYYVGDYGDYWSASPSGSYACHLHFGHGGYDPSGSINRANGLSVRCLQE